MTPQDRMRGAIWGQLVGDAAALGTHWIYDLDELRRRYPRIEGFEAPAPGHYHAGKRPGEQTHYGDGALLMLESLAACGRFDPADFAQRFERFFGGYRGYLDHATRETLRNMAAGKVPPGADDDQMATVTRLAPLVVAHLDEPRLLEVVESATRIAQDNARAVAYAKAVAVVLAALLRGRGVEQALDELERGQAFDMEVVERLRAARAAAARLEVVEATRGLGQSCALVKSFPSAVHALLRHRDSFREAILATIRAGGDNAGRAAVLGAWLGAHLGVDAIPEEWRRRLVAREQIERHVERLIAQAG